MCRGCLGLSLAPPLASLASWRTDPAKNQDKHCLCWTRKSLVTLLQGHSSFLSAHNECISFPTSGFNEGALTRTQWQLYRAKVVALISCALWWWNFNHMDGEVFVWDLCQEPIPLRGAKRKTWNSGLRRLKRHFYDQMKVQREAEDHCINPRVSEKFNKRGMINQFFEC